MIDWSIIAQVKSDEWGPGAHLHGTRPPFLFYCIFFLNFLFHLIHAKWMRKWPTTELKKIDWIYSHGKCQVFHSVSGARCWITSHTHKQFGQAKRYESLPSRATVTGERYLHTHTAGKKEKNEKRKRRKRIKLAKTRAHSIWNQKKIWIEKEDRKKEKRERETSTNIASERTTKMMVLETMFCFSHGEERKKKSSRADL